MKYIGLVMVLMIATGLKAQTVPFTVLPSGHILIESAFEGVKGNFIFDTGAGVNLLFNSFANKLPARSSHNFIVGHRATGEPLKIDLFDLKDLAIGNSKFKGQTFSTFDMAIPGIDGLISLQPFKETTVTLDFVKNQMRIGELDKKQKKKYIDIQVSDIAGRALDIFTWVQLNDSLTIQVMLDAGAGKESFWIHADFIKRLDLHAASLAETERKSEFVPGKVNKFYAGRIKKIAAVNGLSSAATPKVQFVEGLIYEGKTGIDWLGKKIAISVKDKKIYILE